MYIPLKLALIHAIVNVYHAITDLFRVVFFFCDVASEDGLMIR